MKKVILASVLAAAATVAIDAQAAITAVCTGGAAASADVASGSTNFVKVGFKARCSNNIHLMGDDNGTYYRVGAASVKGKFAYFGSTMGGAISPAGTSCAATGCVAADASNAVTNAASS